MLKEAEAITARLGKDVFIKVPVIEEGVKAMKLLKESGYFVTATAVVSVQQAFLAGSVGADYVAPYVNRMATLNIDPFETVSRIRNIFDNQNISTKILGASYKNTQQVMLTYIIQNYFHHRAVEIGVYRIANLKPQRFITVNRHACGKKLLSFVSDFRKEIDNLTALNINYRDGLPLPYIYSFSNKFIVPYFYF